MLEKTKTDGDREPDLGGATKVTKPIQHRWFDQWLIAGGDSLKQLVGDIGQIVDSREQRQRARRPDDETNYRRMLDGIVCNLAYAIINPSPTGWLAVNTRKGAGQVEIRPASIRKDLCAVARPSLQ